MNALTLEKENLGEFESLIPEKLAENIGREYYRAFIVLDEDQTPVASCIYKLMYLESADRDTEARLESIFVDMDHRGIGCGRALMEELKERLDKEGVKITRFEIPKEGNEDTADFLRKFGFVLEEKESDRIHVTIEDLSKSPACKKIRKSDIIGEIESIPLRKVKAGIMNCVFSSRREVEEDLPNLPLFWHQVQLSAYTMKDNKVTGLFLIHQRGEKEFEPILLFALEPGARKDLLNMIRFTAGRALELCPKDADIVINRKDDSIRNLTNALFPAIKGGKAYSGKREE